MWTKRDINHIGYDIIAAAIEVHEELGPGLLESIYEECMVEELKNRNLTVERQRPVKLYYKGKPLKTTLRLDLIVEDLFIVEIKAVEKLNPLYDFQLISYLKLADKPKGILINFNSVNITQQAKHFAGPALLNHPE
jgi:GxxExxY protein